MAKVPESTKGYRPETGGGAEKEEGGAGLRRARAAAERYFAASRRLLAGSGEGFLAATGPAAADGYKSWEEEDARLRNSAGAELSPVEAELYLALTEARAARCRAMAQAWADRQGKAASLGLIDSELDRLGEESWLGAASPAARAALLEAALPAARRHALEKAGLLALGPEHLDHVAAGCMARIASTALKTGMALDPLEAAGFFEAARKFLPVVLAEGLERELKALLAVELARRLAAQATEEELAGEGLPDEVAGLARPLARALAAARARRDRERSVAAELAAAAMFGWGEGGAQSLSPRLWARLDPAARERVLAGGRSASDPRTLGRLAALAAQDPAGFLRADLTPGFSRLTYADYRELSALKEALAAGGPAALSPRLERAAAAARAEGPAFPDEELCAAYARHLEGLGRPAPCRDTVARVHLARLLNEQGLIADDAITGVVLELTGREEGAEP